MSYSEQGDVYQEVAAEEEVNSEDIIHSQLQSLYDQVTKEMDEKEEKMQAHTDKKFEELKLFMVEALRQLPGSSSQSAQDPPTPLDQTAQQAAKPGPATPTVQTSVSSAQTAVPSTLPAQPVQSASSASAQPTLRAKPTASSAPTVMPSASSPQPGQSDSSASAPTLSKKEQLFLSAYPQKEETASPISSIVAAQMCRNWTEPIEKDEDDNYLNMFLTPSNCQEMTVSKVNEPVWQQMIEQEKREDSFWQRLAKLLH